MALVPHRHADHERQGAAVTNFDQRLAPPDAGLAGQILKDPYHFDFLGLDDEARALPDPFDTSLPSIEEIEAEMSRNLGDETEAEKVTPTAPRRHIAVLPSRPGVALPAWPLGLRVLGRRFRFQQLVDALEGAHGPTDILWKILRRHWWRKNDGSHHGRSIDRTSATAVRDE